MTEERDKKDKHRASPKPIGEFEEIILLAVYNLKDGAYGVAIKNNLAHQANRKASIGAIYATLERLERKGYVTSKKSDPTPERGGKAKRIYRIEGSGIEALEHTKKIRDLFWRTITQQGEQV